MDALSALLPTTSGNSPSATAVHHALCALIASQAEGTSEAARGWSEYGSVFLSAGVQDLIRARLAGDGAGSPPAEGEAAEGGPGSSKKRKIETNTEAVGGISWTICCMDGATFFVEVPEHARVAEIKRAIGAAREVPYFAMELFIKDQEKALDDELRMGSLNRPPLFRLVKVSSERLALVALFKSTGGPSDWNDTEGWEELEQDEEANLGDAVGVEDLVAEGRVAKLILPEVGLVRASSGHRDPAAAGSDSPQPGRQPSDRCDPSRAGPAGSSGRALPRQQSAFRQHPCRAGAARSPDPSPPAENNQSGKQALQSHMEEHHGRAPCRMRDRSLGVSCAPSAYSYQICSVCCTP